MFAQEEKKTVFCLQSGSEKDRRRKWLRRDGMICDKPKYNKIEKTFSKL
jgi:hypothetical protein